MMQNNIGEIVEGIRLDVLKYNEELSKKRDEEQFIKRYKNFISGRNVLSDQEYERQLDYFYRTEEHLLKLIELRRSGKI